MQRGTASTPEDFILLLCGDDPVMTKTLNQLSSSGYTYHTMCDSDACSSKCMRKVTKHIFLIVTLAACFVCVCPRIGIAEVLPSNSFNPVRPGVHNTTTMLHLIYGPSQERCLFLKCGGRRTCSWSFRNLPPVVWLHLNIPDIPDPAVLPPFKSEVRPWLLAFVPKILRVLHS